VHKREVPAHGQRGDREQERGTHDPARGHGVGKLWAIWAIAGSEHTHDGCPSVASQIAAVSVFAATKTACAVGLDGSER
jgi:hypothetical protein